MKKQIFVLFLLALAVLPLSAQSVLLRKSVGPVQSRPSAMMHEMGRRPHGAFAQPSPIVPKAPRRAPLLATPDGTTIWGNLLYRASWENLTDTYEYPYGIYSFPASSRGFTLTPIYEDSGFNANGGGVVVGDTYHFVWYAALSPTLVIASYYAYDIDDWSEKGYEFFSDNKFVAQDLTLDPTSNTVYGLFWDANSSYMQLATVDYSTMTRTDIGDGYGSQRFVTIAAGLDGQLYTIGLDGNFYKVDKSTGQLTLVGPTGVLPGGYSQSMTFDPNTGRLYWSAFRNDQTGGLYEVDPRTGTATMVVNYPDCEEITALYIAKKSDDGTPRAVTRLALDYPRGAHVGTISFTMPSNDNADNALVGELTYHITANGTEVKRGTALRGAPVTVDQLELPAGDTKVVVTVSNAAGTGAEATAHQWIGLDNPVRPTILVLYPDTAARTARLSWIPTRTGQHGGYVDPDSVYYVVTRMPDSTVVGPRVTDSTFVDHLPDSHVAAYYYTITPYCGAMQGFTATTGKFISGNPYEVPYRENFDNANAMDVYTPLDYNVDNNTWQYMSGAAGIYSSGLAGLDDWLLTPLIHLRSDRTYNVSFVVETGGEAYTEQLSLSYGTDADFDNYTTIMPTTDLTLKGPRQFSYSIRPSVEANYVLAFHATSAPQQYDIKVDDISVTEQALVTAPDSVTALTATPGAHGARHATVSFRAPLRRIDGRPLATLHAITLSRNGSVVNTWNNPTPGETYTYEDENPADGLNDYTVVAANENGGGQPARVSTFTGNDTPLPPSRLRLGLDGNTATLTWTSPGARGANNGFVDTLALRYDVYDKDGHVVQADVDGTSWSATVDNTGSQRLTHYGLSAKSNGLESGVVTSNTVVLGKPWPMPFQESFALGSQDYPLWWIVGSDASNTWGFNTLSTADDDGGALYYLARRAGEESSINSGKIAITGSNPKLTFSHYVQPGVDNTLRVEVSTDKADSVLLAEVNYASVADSAGWRTLSVPLRPLDAEYVILKFHAICNDVLTPVMIDNINVADVKPLDISATLSSPTKARIGTTIVATVKVENVGEETARGAMVTLYNGTREMGSESLADLPAASSATVNFSVEPKAIDGGTLALYAVATLDGDGDPANNTTETIDVKVAQSTLPAIDDLGARAEGGNVVLSWTRPEAPETVTDDFESYEAWERNNFGDWTTIDMDDTDTWGIDGIVFPHNTGRMAYLMFNTDDVAWPDADYLLVVGAHSGKQYAASFCARNVESDDYLCSPLLSGNAQEVSFWAKSLSSEEPESFDVLATTSRTPYAYSYSPVEGSSVQHVPAEWTRYTVALPQGTRHFAIHHTSTDKFALLVDDVTFSPEQPTLSGYNVYRDGTLVGSTTPLSTSWTDAAGDGADHTYYVTAVYKQGEGPLSNAATLATGVRGVESAGSVPATTPAYGVTGQRVPESYHGIIVRKGKKVAR